MATSDLSTATAPISGRLPLSRSPPQPNTTSEPLPHIGPQGIERLGERVRRMGIVDEDRRAGSGGAGEIEASARAAQIRKERQHRFGLRSRRHAEASGNERVGGLKGADERQAEGRFAALHARPRGAGRSRPARRRSTLEFRLTRPTEITESPRDLASAATCSPASVSTSMTAPAPGGSSSPNRRSFSLK